MKFCIACVPFDKPREHFGEDELHDNALFDFFELKEQHVFKDVDVA